MTHEARGTKHEARILAMTMMVVCSSAALAMPTQQELKKAQPLVAELMAPTMDDFKAKKKTAADVAEVSMSFATRSESEAEKFLFVKGAISYYVRDEEFEKAADAVGVLKTEVREVPPEVIIEILSKVRVQALGRKAPRLFGHYRLARSQVQAAKDVQAFKAALEKNPGKLATVRKLAEAYAVSGDWKSALEEFSKLNDSAAQMAKKEFAGTADSAALGEFWWGYEPTYENSGDTFKVHAIGHYREALSAGEITGLKKDVIERRIAGCDNIPVGGADRAMSRLFVVPTGKSRGPDVELQIGKDNAIGFVSCLSGRFQMGFNRGKSCLKFHEVTISRPFWIAKTPVTYGQVDVIMGKMPRRIAEKGNPDFCLDILGGDKVPAAMSYNQASKVLEMLNRKYGNQLPKGYVFRVASEAEYEYAAKSGRSEYNIKTDGVGEITTFEERLKALRDKGYDAIDYAKWPWRVPYFAVGSKKPNAWGIYDMFTSGWAYVLDTVNCKDETDTESLTPFYQDGSVDPVQISVEKGAMCVTAGCGWGYFGSAKYKGKGWLKFLMEMGDKFHDDCFLRLVIGPDLVSEWKAKNGKK